MNGEYKRSSSRDEQCREFVLEFIKQKELIKSQDNLILSEKAFVVNAVLNWCYKKAQDKKMTPVLWGKYKKILGQYIAGIINIQWTDNNFNIIEVIDDKPKPQPQRSTRRRRK